MQQLDDAINSSMLPADAGCVVDNVATISAIYRAVAKGIYSMDRIVTAAEMVFDESQPKRYLRESGRIGLRLAGGYKVDPEKIISGGPMMGFSMFTVDVPVTKTSSSILCFTKDEATAFVYDSNNCEDVEVCPVSLIPS